MKPDDLKFETVKKAHGWYFVEYLPPAPGVPFSNIQLSVIEPQSTSDIAKALETEAKYWLSRYPIPLMATAFSASEDVIRLKDVRDDDLLFAWVDSSDVDPVIHWGGVSDDDLPKFALDPLSLKQVFSDIPFKTGDQIRHEVEKKYAGHKVGLLMLFVWAVIVPLGVAILEWWSDLLGLVVLGLATIKAVIECLRYFGRLPKSKRQEAKEEEERQMRHHHWHCSRNPEGFTRLKIENYERMAIEKTLKTATAIKADQSTRQGEKK